MKSKIHLSIGIAGRLYRNEDSVRPLPVNRGESVGVVRARVLGKHQRHAQLTSTSTEGLPIHIVPVTFQAQEGDAGQLGNGVLQQLQPLGVDVWRGLHGNPVTFPPGRARLVTTPLAIGSTLTAMTMGTVFVTRIISLATSVLATTITSAPARMSSPPISPARATPWPSADRRSSIRFDRRGSQVQCKAATNAFTEGLRASVISETGPSLKINPIR